MTQQTDLEERLEVIECLLDDMLVERDNLQRHIQYLNDEISHLHEERERLERELEKLRR
jgi:chromosome segregation ATPase